MYDRFTERARQVVELAKECARWRNHDFVEPSHLLIGLLREDEGVAARVLRSLDIDEQKCELPPRGPTSRDGEVPHSDNTRLALQLALREALALGHNYIGTEHILLALTREEDLGVLFRTRTPGEVRDEVMRTLYGLSGPGETNITPPTESEPSLDLQDYIHDLLEGIERWVNVKVGALTWDTEDEALLRWVQGSSAYKLLRD